MMFRKTFAEIDLKALQKNYEFIQSSLPGRFLCPMVKANAYGHGDLIVAKFLETLGTKQVGVCLVEEGLRLRKGKIKSDIIVFRGFEKAAVDTLFEHHLTPVISQFQQIEDLVTASKKLNRSMQCHVKFDTGMNRLGFHPSEVNKVIAAFKKSRRLSVRGVLTHLHSGEDAGEKGGASLKQLQQLAGLIKDFSEVGSPDLQFHAYNSAGLAHLIRAQTDASHPLTLFEKKLKRQFSFLKHPFGLRPGLMIYGYCESLQSTSQIQPVMTLKSQIAAVRVLKKNQTVSYGATWKAKQKSYIGVVPIGYADGYHRLNSNRAQVTLLGHQVPVVGRVCMDYLMVDVTEMLQKTRMSVSHDALYQSEVILFGPKSQHNQISAEDVAQTSDTISWEVLTSVGERVPRIYTGAPPQKILKLVNGK